MTWNWQHKNWPEFIYNEDEFKDFELNSLRMRYALWQS